VEDAAVIFGVAAGDQMHRMHLFGQDTKEEETVRVIIGFPNEFQQAKFEATVESDRSFNFRNKVRYNRTDAASLTLPVSQLDAL
jgi:hypothetical protein